MHWVNKVMYNEDQMLFLNVVPFFKGCHCAEWFMKLFSAFQGSVFLPWIPLQCFGLISDHSLLRMLLASLNSDPFENRLAGITDAECLNHKRDRKKIDFLPGKISRMVLALNTDQNLSFCA